MKKDKLILPLLTTLLLFFSFGWTSMTSNISYKVLACAFICTAVVVLLIKRKNFDISNYVVLSTSLYVVIAGISTLYANAGKFAINEFIKVLLAFAVFVFLSIKVSKDKKSLTQILWLATGLSSVTAFLSIEGASLGIISPIIEKFLYGSDIVEYASYNANRLTSIFGNSNVFASMLGVCLFLSLYLYIKSEDKKAKYIQGFFLIIQASAFLLAFSMGGTVSLAVAILAFIIFAENDISYRGLIITLQVVTMAFIGIVCTIGTYTKDVSSGSILPFAMIILGTVALLVVDKFIGKKASDFLCKYSKQAIIIVVSICVLFAGFAVVAFTNTSGSMSLNSGTTIYRTIYPEAGEYTLQVNANSEELYLRVLTRDTEQIILNTDTQIFASRNGNDLQNTFTIDTDVEQVRIAITNDSDKAISIENITFVGEEDIELKLSYTFLPENIVSRLQGLRTNNSLITRLQYFQDSFALFLQSPIIGHGLGGFENAIQSVQKYQYETKYAHNHFFQVMVDMGILGFASYLFLLISCIIALVKSRKENDLAPILFGALMMIIVHGANEFSMSSGEFLPFAFAIFALIAVTCGVKIKKLEQYDSQILLGTTIAMAIFAILLAGNIIANININASSVTLDTLTTNASIDVYEKNDYKLSYVLATSTSTDSTIRATSDKYLKSLEKAKSNTISLYLADYYIDNGNPEKSYEQIVRYIDYSVYDPDTWNLALSQYINTLFTDENIEHFFSSKDAYIEIIEDLIGKLDITNQSSIGQITLDDYTLMGIRNVLASKDIETLDEFYNYVYTVIYDSKYDTTINDNGTYDALVASYTTFDINDGVTNAGDKIRVKIPYTYYAMYKIEIDSTSVSKIATPTDEITFTVTDEGKTIAIIDTNTISSMTNATEGYVDVIINFTGDEAEFGDIKISR
ncbi:MAG: O-antigen ligase family protein [Clostridia bacterium]